MRKGIIVDLFAITTSAFAADGKNQRNVYDDLRQGMQPSPNATVDEEVTALIKRNMANLLYPVDMSSFTTPDDDPKFRDLIVVLQQQMGVPPTGILTMDQFNRLDKAAHSIDEIFVGQSPYFVSMDEDGTLVSASGSRAMDGIADRISSVRISCYRAIGTCELNEAIFNLDGRFLFVAPAVEYQINNWTLSRVTATTDAPCSTSLMTIDVKGKQVTAETVPRPNCTEFTQAKPWHLVDGFPVAWKLSQDRMNSARMLVYPPAKRLMPIQK
jgi:hypothetical protein